MYETQSFKVNEIFEKETLERINNKSLFEVHDVRTINNGLSTTICYLKTGKFYEEFYFVLKQQKWGINLYLHQKRDEFWFAIPGMAILSLNFTLCCSSMVKLQINGRRVLGSQEGIHLPWRLVGGCVEGVGLFLESK
jgi:mannose-6-phosphate isomerase-like protein (cupin superfamily)